MPSSNYSRISGFILIYLLISCTTKTPTRLVNGSDNKSLEVITSTNDTLLSYHYGIKYPEAGKDDSYQRSGFIHPIKTLEGYTLTQIQPPGHYHHYGIWNPWTHTLFEGDTLDFWNLYKQEGTVRHMGFDTVYSTSDFSRYVARLDHVVLKQSEDKTALHERQEVTVYNPDNNKYIVDIKIDIVVLPIVLWSY